MPPSSNDIVFVYDNTDMSQYHMSDHDTKSHGELFGKVSYLKSLNNLSSPW